jgi:hypothetical protein
MKLLPIGIQSCADVRSNGYLYVDKTEDIYRLITSGKTFFLSRPRRFGKSLLISTLDAIFAGQKELFEGLYIYDKWDWIQQHPVIRLDWSRVSHESAEMMKRTSWAFLKTIAENNQLTLKKEDAPDCFYELIEQLHCKTGQKVVVLIDEYDMPILDAMDETFETRDETRKFLQSFYKILKAADDHLRFVFLTGVSKFSKVSIFSGLNNLNDITLDAQFATICGYTQAELESYFEEHIQAMTGNKWGAREDVLTRIRDWYNGYSWDAETSVYNPFSTLLLFYKKDFKNYWFASGTPTFLVNLIKERNEVEKLLEPVSASSTGFDSADPEVMDTVQLLFQTGYLTVKKVETAPFENTTDYVLGIPNQEVRQSLTANLFAGYAGYSVSDTHLMSNRLRLQLLDGDEEGFRKSMQEMFAHIPYHLHIPREAYYHSLLLLWLKLLGFEVQGEISTNIGRIDAVWTWKNHAVVAELKYLPLPAEKSPSPKTLSKHLDEAMGQIRDRRYYERYQGYQVTLAAIVFAGKEIACRLIRI